MHRLYLIPMFLLAASTNSLAESFNKSDIVGIKLGIKRSEAEYILQNKVKNAFVYRENATIKSNYFSKEITLGLISDITNQDTAKSDANSRDLDQVWVSVDPNDSDGIVFGVSRYTTFTTGNRSTFRSYVDALITKYGQYTKKVGDDSNYSSVDYFWIEGDVRNIEPNGIGKCLQMAEFHISNAKFNNPRVNAPQHGRGSIFASQLSMNFPDYSTWSKTCKSVLHVRLEHPHFHTEDQNLVAAAEFTFVNLQEADELVAKFRKYFSDSARNSQDKINVEHAKRTPQL